MRWLKEGKAKRRKREGRRKGEEEMKGMTRRRIEKIGDR